ncbi:hypothetical protein BD560DRAFT_388190 [Blakeslea trispora]|nr:hypothetical protein BD560DRAFT_388190 [Blakeslea trispora]
MLLLLSLFSFHPTHSRNVLYHLPTLLRSHQARQNHQGLKKILILHLIQPQTLLVYPTGLMQQVCFVV